MHVERFESALWQTASLLFVADGESVAVDPCISTEEVEAIDRRAQALGSPVTHVLATHAAVGSDTALGTGKLTLKTGFDLAGDAVPGRLSSAKDFDYTLSNPVSLAGVVQLGAGGAAQ